MDDRTEAADLELGRHRTAIPRRRRVAGTAVVDEREALALGILELKRQPAVALDDLTVRHLVFVEALQPPCQRRFTVHAEAGPDDAASPAALARCGPVEKGEVRARTAFGVGIEQVIGAHVVLVHRALDQPHAERPGVEAVVLLDRGGDRGEVMDARELHGRAPRVCQRAPGRRSCRKSSPAMVAGGKRAAAVLPSTARGATFARSSETAEVADRPGACQCRVPGLRLFYVAASARWAWCRPGRSASAPASAMNPCTRAPSASCVMVP